MTTISIRFLVTLASVLVTMAIHVCVDVSSAPQLKDVSLQFFFFNSAWTPPTRRTPPFANALVATHHSPIVYLHVGSQLDPVLGIEEPGRKPAPATKSGAGDREAGPAAGGTRLGPVPEDRRAGAAARDITKAGSGAGESRNRSGSRDPRLGPRPC